MEACAAYVASTIVTPQNASGETIAAKDQRFALSPKGPSRASPIHGKRPFNEAASVEENLPGTGGTGPRTNGGRSRGRASRESPDGILGSRKGGTPIRAP